MMIFIALISILYLIIISLILNSIKRIFTNFPLKSKPGIKISVVVAAKNEENNLSQLINSLKNQTYPENLFEVIIVDDNSTDNTFEKGNELTSGLNNFAIYKVEEKKYPGKKGALQFGIEKSNNPFILITDADCLPGKNWIKAFSGKFELDYDFLFGPAPFIKTSSFINKVSCFENLRASILTFSAASFGLPYSAAARSFGFSRAAFEKLSGYKNTTETLSGDDDLLLREAVKNKLKIGIAVEDESLVYSSTVQNFSDYLKQKARHTTTSFHYLLIHKILLGVWHLLNILMLLSPALMIFDSKFLIIFLLKLAGDLNVVLTTQRYFGYRFNFMEIIIQQVVYEFMLVVNFINAMLKKTEWK